MDGNSNFFSKIIWPKFIFAVLISVYFINYAFHYTGWIFLNYADLIFHEAGHLIFGIFGEWVGVFGGTLCQLLIPIIIIVYFYLKDQKYSAAIVTFWLGQNFFNVAVYMGDAIKMQLPLLGGDNSVHDWNNLFVKFGLLHYTNQLTSFVKILGFLCLILAIFFSIKHSFKEKEEIIEL